MKSKKALPFYLLILVFCSLLPAQAKPDSEQTDPATVMVIEGFANIRNRPDAQAKIIKEIGYGTILKVLGKTGKYFRVTPIHAAPSSEGQSWYIHQSEVEAAETQPLRPSGENRRVTFEPLRPIAGQPMTYTAHNFRTPNLLKWDMGDGTVLVSGSTSAQALQARMTYVYAAAGTYEVKVYDDNGDLGSPPLTIQVPVVAYPRSLQVTPEKPLANKPLTITAFNFNTPENILWDLGDGSTIKPGDKNGIIKPDFMITHIYAAAGTYTVKAWDSSGNKSLPPLSISIRVAAEPTPVKSEPVKINVVPDKTGPAPDRTRIATEKSDVGAPVASSPVPHRIRKNLLIKIGPYAGFFQPRDADLRTVYGDGNVIYGGRLGIRIWRGFYMWLSASRFVAVAKTTFSEEKTTLTLIPLSAFLRCKLGLGFFNPYAGIGFTYLNFKEESAFPTVTGNGSHTAYEGGFELKMNRHFILDFNVRYDQIKVKPTGFEVDLGGLQAGVSLLLSF